MSETKVQSDEPHISAPSPNPPNDGKPKSKPKPRKPPRTGSRWRTWDGKSVRVVGSSIGAGDTPTFERPFSFVHYVLEAAATASARTCAVEYWEGDHVEDGVRVKAFTPLPDADGPADWNPEDFRASMEPLVRVVEEHARHHAAIRSASTAKYLLDKLRKDMNGNASRPAGCFVWGVLSGLRAAGMLTDEDVEAYRERVRRCPGHDGMSFCAYCGDICRVCGENDPCGQEECAEIRFGDGPRDKGFPPAPAAVSP